MAVQSTLREPTLRVDHLPSAKEIQTRLNKRLDLLTHVDHEGDRRAFVCTVCDKFLANDEDNCMVTENALRKMQDVLSLARNSSAKCKPPDRNQVAGELLDDNYDSYADRQRKSLLLDAEAFMEMVLQFMPCHC